MASRAHFGLFLDFIIERREKHISAPQNLISTNGLYKRTCEKASESKKVEAKPLRWPPELILAFFWTSLLKEGKNISAHLKILFEPMNYIRGHVRRPQSPKKWRPSPFDGLQSSYLPFSDFTIETREKHISAPQNLI